jgi:hypothetical protein
MDMAFSSVAPAPYRTMQKSVSRRLTERGRALGR